VYLVHLHLLARQRGLLLPSHTATLITECADDELRIEHVNVHPYALPGPVIGVFVHATSLVTAEAMAAGAWRCASAAETQLLNWQILRAEVPLLIFPEGG
jgi:hypothetical protein